MLQVGSSDFGITLDGPINDKTTFVFSARRSYLQLLFSAIGLPFLPTYNDSQFKIKTKINDKNQITFIGLGAIDDFVLKVGIEGNEFSTVFIENFVCLLNTLLKNVICGLLVKYISCGPIATSCIIPPGIFLIYKLHRFLNMFFILNHNLYKKLFLYIY